MSTRTAARLMWLPLLAAPVIAQEVAERAEKVHITFGVYSYQRPADVYRSFSPVIDRLEGMVAKELAQPVRIHLRVHRTYEECLQAFVDGDIDFVRFGPSSYVLAKQRNPAIQLLAADQEDGKKVCLGVIAVARDSKIRSLADLKGTRFAFGDDQSTIGRYLSQAQLVKAGIRAADLTKFRYLGRHDIVFKAVELGDYDAGALHIDIFEQLNREHQRLRVIHTFENVGKPWLARADLPADQVRALRQSLLRLQDADALKALKISGCMAATDCDYEPVREAMQLSPLFLGEPAAPAGEPAAPPVPAAPAVEQAPGTAPGAVSPRCRAAR